jgi:lambda family phage portal protein
MRARSAQVFTDNIYARGLIRRLVTNVINTGLNPEATPRAGLLGLPWTEDQWTAWAEDIESRWELWGSDPRVCDWLSADTWAILQQTIYREATIEGDVLVVLRTGPAGVPRVQMIPGSAVTAPWGQVVRAGNVIKYGVELDPQGRQVAYWIRQGAEKYTRIPAYGEKSGRRIAWLFYGTDKRANEVRGCPLLQLVIQSVREIDRYRDATQRKAILNAILAVFVKKNGERIGSGALTGGATRKTAIQGAGEDGVERRFNIASLIPGVVMEELQAGEEITAHGSDGTDHKFGEFEAAIVAGLAWAHEIPPEILTLAFRQNYSASRAAINELKSFLDRERGRVADQVSTPIYQEFLIGLAANEKISAPGLLATARDVRNYEYSAAWMAVEWNGAIKQSVDLLKEVNAYKAMIAEGFITHDRATRDLTGMKYSRVVARLRKENELKAAAMEPIGGYNPTGGSRPAEPAIDDSGGEG